MSKGFFNSLETDEEEKESPKPVKRVYTPRPKTDNSKLIMEFTNVVNCIHVNFNKTQREILRQIVGSHSVPDVRKFLTDKFLEALKQ